MANSLFIFFPNIAPVVTQTPDSAISGSCSVGPDGWCPTMAPSPEGQGRGIRADGHCPCFLPWPAGSGCAALPCGEATSLCLAPRSSGCALRLSQRVQRPDHRGSWPRPHTQFGAGLPAEPGPRDPKAPVLLDFQSPSGGRRRPLDGSAPPRIQRGAAPGRRLRPGWGVGRSKVLRVGPSGGVAPSPAGHCALHCPSSPRGSCWGFVFTSESQMSEACTVVA